MKIWMQGAFVVAVAILLWGATAQAQTDVALSGYRTIASSTTGSGTKQTPTDSEGGLFEWRHIANPLVGYEFEVTFNPANQAYIGTNATPPTCYPTGPTGTPATCQPQEVSGKATQFGGTWIFSKKIGNVRPFALGGAGFIVTVPGSSPYSVNYGYEAGLYLWWRRGLEFSPASRSSPASPRQYVQGAEFVRPLQLDDQIYPSLRAHGRRLLPFLKPIALGVNERTKGSREGFSGAVGAVLPFHYGVPVPGMLVAPSLRRGDRRKRLKCADIGDGGQKYTNAAAGIDLIDAHSSAHCESGSGLRDAIGSCICSGTRFARCRAPAAPGSPLARARRIVLARHAAHVHWTGHLLRAMVAQFLGPESDLPAVHRAGRFRPAWRCARHRFRPRSIESMDCISRRHSTS